MRIPWVKSAEEKEFDRQFKAKQGRSTVQRYVQKLTESQPKLLKLAQKAVQLEDEVQLRQILIQYLWTQQQVRRWDRYLLTFDTVEARVAQARSTREFLSSLQAMGQSMLANSNPAEVAKMQMELQKGLMAAEQMEDRLKLIMEYTDDAVYRIEDAGDQDLERMKASLMARGSGDRDVEDELSKLEATVRDMFNGKGSP